MKAGAFGPRGRARAPDEPGKGETTTRGGDTVEYVVKADKDFVKFVAALLDLDTEQASRQIRRDKHIQMLISKTI